MNDLFLLDFQPRSLNVYITCLKLDCFLMKAEGSHHFHVIDGTYDLCITWTQGAQTQPHSVRIDMLVPVQFVEGSHQQ